MKYLFTAYPVTPFFDSLSPTSSEFIEEGELYGIDKKITLLWFIYSAVWWQRMKVQF